jgi:predicted naringenin-chalcone synthase
MRDRVPWQQTPLSVPPSCALLGIGTAVPDHPVSQQAILERVVEELGEARREAKLARRLFQHALVEKRFSCLAHVDRLPPSVTMRIFREEAPRLGLAAASRALARAGVEPRQVTHLIVTTSTGAMTPGPDVDLASLLGLRPSTERTLLGFMGCSGAFHGLRVARRAALEGNDARVLLVCVELSSIHFRPRPDPGSLAAHALFGDGAGAVVLASGVADDEALADLGGVATHLDPAPATS